MSAGTEGEAGLGSYDEHELFVPGRVCLFGEHSDWAGDYRSRNHELECGYTLVVGTNQARGSGARCRGAAGSHARGAQGLCARVRPHRSHLVVTTITDKGKQEGPFQVPMTPEALLEGARPPRPRARACGGLTRAAQWRAEAASSPTWPASRTTCRPRTTSLAS